MTKFPQIKIIISTGNSEGQYIFASGEKKHRWVCVCIKSVLGFKIILWQIYYFALTFSFLKINQTRERQIKDIKVFYHWKSESRNIWSNGS